MRIAVVAIATCLVAPAAAHAQRLGIATGYFTYTRDDYSSTTGGLGIEGVLRHKQPQTPEVGLGVQVSRFGLDDEDETLSVLSIFGEARHIFPGPTRASPYLGGRAGWVHQSGTIEEIDITSNGFSVGATAGFLIPMSPFVGIDLGLTGSYLKYGNTQVEGQSAADTRIAGFQWALRAGVDIALFSRSR